MDDFLVGVGVLLVIEGIMMAAFTGWMREAMERALAAPDTLLRYVGIIAALIGIAIIWLERGVNLG